jgi:hypothetical protein
LIPSATGAISNDGQDSAESLNASSYLWLRYAYGCALQLNIVIATANMEILSDKAPVPMPCQSPGSATRDEEKKILTISSVRRTKAFGNTLTMPWAKREADPCDVS